LFGHDQDPQTGGFLFNEENKIKGGNIMEGNLLKIKRLWKKIKDLPYKREKARYNFLVEPVNESGIGFNTKKIMIFDENSFRKWYLRISGETVFFKNKSTGRIIDIIPAEEFLEELKK
jgi:hypothetical protein